MEKESTHGQMDAVMMENGKTDNNMEWAITKIHNRMIAEKEDGLME